MNYDKSKLFFKELIPVLEYLTSIWVTPNTVNEDNIQIGCLYCDMQGGNNNHDTDCVVDKAKRALEKYRQIEQNFSVELKDRTPDEILEITSREQYRKIMPILYNSITEIIPTDLKDSFHSRVICHCQMMSGSEKHNLRKTREHFEKCPFVSLSNCLKILL